MTSPRTYAVIGASAGLGLATVRALARAGHRVIAAGRDVDRTRAAVTKAAGAHAARVEVRRVDLAELADVRRFARELAAGGATLDGLVCNAGLQHAGAPRSTADGFEETFAVNHLAHVALVSLAFAALRPGARIVFIGSGTHDPGDRGARRFGFRGGRYTSARELAEGAGDPTADAAQQARDRYATSKLCNLLAAHELARRIPVERAAVLALDPGLMPGTGLARDYGPIRRFAWNTILPLAARVMPGASSARRSGAALAWLLTDSSLAGTTGAYFDYRRRRIEPWDGARRADWAAELDGYCSAVIASLI